MAQGPYEQLLRLQAPKQPPASATAAAQRQYTADDQYYQQAQSSAQAAISDAQRLLGRATSDRDTAGATAAAKISSASHDSLADSWWDQFKQMISGIASNLKTIATVIGYIANSASELTGGGSAEGLFGKGPKHHDQSFIEALKARLGPDAEITYVAGPKPGRAMPKPSPDSARPTRGRLKSLSLTTSSRITWPTVL